MSCACTRRQRLCLSVVHHSPSFQSCSHVQPCPVLSSLCQSMSCTNTDMIKTVVIMILSSYTYNKIDSFTYLEPIQSFVSNFLITPLLSTLLRPSMAWPGSDDIDVLSNGCHTLPR